MDQTPLHSGGLSATFTRFYPGRALSPPGRLRRARDHACCRDARTAGVRGPSTFRAVRPNRRRPLVTNSHSAGSSGLTAPANPGSSPADGRRPPGGRSPEPAYGSTTLTPGAPAARSHSATSSELAVTLSTAGHSRARTSRETPRWPVTTSSACPKPERAAARARAVRLRSAGRTGGPGSGRRPRPKGHPGSRQRVISPQRRPDDPDEPGPCLNLDIARPTPAPATGMTSGAAPGRGETTTTSRPAAQARLTAATVAAAAGPPAGG